MKIQTLSIVVPAGCPNKCRFCVSELSDKMYPNQIEHNIRFRSLYREDFIKRMAFSRDNGCNTLIYTGDGEPLYNPRFLEQVAGWNRHIERPFRSCELQTCGVSLDDEKLRWLRNEIEVTTISVSFSNVFDSVVNAYYNQTKKGLEVNIDKLCSEIKRYDFVLRISLNLTETYNNLEPATIFERAAALNANQITFRVLYYHPLKDCDKRRVINDWIKEHKANEIVINRINEYIKSNGRPLEILPFGAMRYSVNGMSVVVDDDCMNTDIKEELKYLILRPDCKLYTKWDDRGSILF